MRKALAVVMLGLGWMPATAFGGTLTWEQVVSRTRNAHPDLAAAKESVSRARADQSAITSDLLPQITGSVDADRSRAAGSGARTDSYSYGISGSQLVFDGFKTTFDVLQAVRNVESEGYAYRATSSDVRLGARAAFIELLRAQELIRITEAIALRRRQSRDLIRLRYEGGREHKGSLMTAEANLAQADFEVEKARRDLTLAQRSLLVRMGEGRFEPVEASGSLDLTAVERDRPSFETLAEETPLLRQLIVLKEAARWGVRSSQADFFPSVYATASRGRRASEWPPDHTEWSLGTSVSVPIFEGGRQWAALSGSQASYRQALAEEISGRNAVLLTLETAWNRLQDAVDQVGVQRMFLDAARERSTIAESEYSTGLISFNDWIIIEDNLVQFEKRYLDARADALSAEAQWIQAKGETLDEA